MAQYTIYPDGIDSSNQLPMAVDNVTPVKGEVVNRQREAIIAIESELGIQPSGTYTTVRARLDALDALLETITGGLGALSEVLDEGVVVRTSVTSLNFVGPGVTATAGAETGRVDVSFSGAGGALTVQQSGSTVVAAADTMNFIGGVSVTSTGPNTVQINVLGEPIVQKQETIAVTVNGQTAFTLSETPMDSTAVEMFVNGVKQQYGAGKDYYASGTSVTYIGSIALQTTDVVEFWYITSGTTGGGGGGSQTLSQTLSFGNTTDGYNIVLSIGDAITSASGTITLSGNVDISGKLTVAGLIDPTGLVLDEQVSNPGGVVAGKGTVWVLNSTPNVLVFTDDTGVDTVISAPATIPTLGEVLAAGNITDGYSIVFSAGDGILAAATSGVGFSIGFQSVAVGTGGDIAITGQQGAATSAGGNITLTGGAGGATSGDAGSVSLTGGTPVDGNGGAVFVSGSNGVGTNRSGGTVSIVAGTSTGSATGPDVSVTGGSSAAGRSGNVVLTGGTTGGSFKGGAIVLTGGDGGPGASGLGGNIVLTGGNAGAGSGAQGGFVSIISGAGDGAGPEGDISFETSGGFHAAFVGSDPGNLQFDGNNAQGKITVGGTGSVPLYVSAGAGGIVGGTLYLSGGTGGSSGAVVFRSGTTEVARFLAQPNRGGFEWAADVVATIQQAQATSGPGSDFGWRAQDAASLSNGAGGQIQITGGFGDGTGVGGDVFAAAGNGGATGNGGNVTLYGGNGGATSGNGGNVSLSPGLGFGGGSNGEIILDGYTTANGHILTGLATPVNGPDAVNKSYVDGLTGGSTSPKEISFRLSGVYSGASVPGFFEPPYPIRTSRTITEVVLMRRTAGSSGTTRVDVQINGVSIFASDPAKPQVSFGTGDNATDIVTAFTSSALVPGDYLDVVLETVEGGSPEGLNVLVRYA